MACEWNELPFSEAVLLNPVTSLAKGAVYPFVEMAAITAGTRNVRCSEHRDFSGGGSRFQDGDTLMARITPCLENGKLARFKAPAGEPVGHGSTEFIVIRGRPNVTDNDYAYYLTISPEVRSFAISQMTGTSGRQRVPTDALGGISVPVPPLPEQRAIAHILGTLDDKIELNRKMNETLEQMARAIFKSWFVDFDPVRAKAEGRHPYGMGAETAALFPDGFQDSELGKIPRGSRAGVMTDLLSQYRESIVPSSYPDEIFNHCSLPAFDSGEIPTQEPGADVKSNKWSVPSDTVLISKLNPDTPRVWWPVIDGLIRTICSTEFIVAKPSPGIASEYIYSMLKSSGFSDKFATFVTGTSKSHQRVKPDDFLKMGVVIPDRVCIDAFQSITESLFKQGRLSRLESQSLIGLRDSLLPKLLNGEIRPNPE